MMSSPQRTQEAPSADAAEVLYEVYGKIVGIHAAVEERLTAEPEIVLWAERELRDLMRYISESKAVNLRPKTRPTYDDE